MRWRTPMRRCATTVSFCAAGCVKRIGRPRSATLRRPLRMAATIRARLTLAGFSIGMDGHDRAAAFIALEAALAISPSSALTYILGSVMLAWGGEAERAIEWSERGMRLSPLDPWAFAAYDAQATACLARKQGVDGRDKPPGHDDRLIRRVWRHALNWTIQFMNARSLARAHHAAREDGDGTIKARIPRPDRAAGPRDC